MSGVKVHILMGLPGSGKTFFAESFGKDADYCDLNSIHGNIDAANIQWFLNRARKDQVIFDGLILTSEDLKFLLDVITKKTTPEEIIVHYWKENRERCLKNDQLRGSSKEKDSKITIKNADFDSLDVIKTIPNINIQVHEVYSSSDSDLVIKKYSPRHIDGDYVITSEEWCNGGSWGDWRGNHGTVESEPPKEFTQLDDLLEELCPEITFLRYKKS